MKRILFGALVLASAVITPVFASTYQFQSGPAVEYSLAPHSPQEFSNVFMWKVKATCKVITTENEVPIQFTVIRKKGSVNNINMAAGDPPLTLVFFPDQKVDIVAEAGGVVRMENLGEKTISTSCTTS